jgi:uncharacterized caspase-like protein
MQMVDQCREANPETWHDTRLYFFVAGHGIAPTPRGAALLAANASPNHLNEHVSCEALLLYFTRVQHFRQLVIFADCCRTPDERAKQLAPPWTEDDALRGDVRKFFAAGAHFFNKSYEKIDGPPDRQRGYFTRALLDGLKGAALPSGSAGPLGSVFSNEEAHD